MDYDEAPPVGSKLPERYENPLDWLVLKRLLPVTPIFRALGVTPNMLTAASAVSAGLALYFMTTGRVGMAMLLWGLNYVFDLADGLQARVYDQQSVIGDVADHLTDILSILGLYAIIVYEIGAWKNWSWANTWPLLVEVALMACAMLQMACQEKYSQSRTAQYIPVMGVDTAACIDHNHMLWTRYFGVATVTVWHLFLIAFYGNRTR